MGMNKIMYKTLKKMYHAIEDVMGSSQFYFLHSLQMILYVSYYDTNTNVLIQISIEQDIHHGLEHRQRRCSNGESFCDIVKSLLQKELRLVMNCRLENKKIKLYHNYYQTLITFPYSNLLVDG